MAELPLAPLERLMRKPDESIRVSEEAKIVLREILEEIAVSISERAIKLAKHRGGKTITADDIKLAK